MKQVRKSLLTAIASTAVFAGALCTPWTTARASTTVVPLTTPGQVVYSGETLSVTLPNPGIISGVPTIYFDHNPSGGLATNPIIGSINGNIVTWTMPKTLSGFNSGDHFYITVRPLTVSFLPGFGGVYYPFIGGGQSFVWNSSPMPTSLPTPPPITTNWAWDGIYGVPYKLLQLQGGVGPSPYIWSLASGSLPRGLTLSTSGLISGTPTGPNGTSNFTVQMKDANGNTSYMPLSITIVQAPALSITTSSLSPAREGKVYTTQLKGTGVSPIQWSLTSGNLPSGLSLNADGTISGTPTGNGQYSFTVQATDGSGSKVEQALTLNVAKPPKGEIVISYPNFTEAVPSFVVGRSPYMPIWYVMQALKQDGITSTWDGTNWRMTTQAHADLTNIEAGSGNKEIYLNGVLVQRANMTVATDPYTMRKTTYVWIWYVAQVLKRLGLQSTWDGTTWTVTK